MPIDADTQKAINEIGASIATLQTRLEELRAGHAPKAEVDELKKFISELKVERTKAAQDAADLEKNKPKPKEGDPVPVDPHWTDHFDLSKD